MRDFLATVCRVLGIDSTRKLDTPDGRPVRVVDKGASASAEVLA